jgi:hypothetical protein
MEKEAAAANGEKSIDAGDVDADAQQQQQHNLQLAEKIRESLAEEEAQETIDDDDGNGEDDDEEEGHVSNDDVDTPKNEGLEREGSQVVLPGGDSDDSEESSDATRTKSENENENEGEAGGDADEKRAIATSATKKGGATHKQPIEFPKLCSSPSLTPEAGSLHLAVTSRLGPSKTTSSPAIPLYSGPAAAQYLGEAAASLPDVSRLGGEEPNVSQKYLTYAHARSVPHKTVPLPSVCAGKRIGAGRRASAFAVGLVFAHPGRHEVRPPASALTLVMSDHVRLTPPRPFRTGRRSRSRRRSRRRWRVSWARGTPSPKARWCRATAATPSGKSLHHSSPLAFHSFLSLTG